MTEPSADFAKAFLAAQRDMGSVVKNASNPAFKSKYADLASVVDAVIPAFNKAGIGVMQHADYDGEAVSVETWLIHESGAHMKSTLHLRPTKADPQGVGSATTYGRRYALLALAGVAPEDDDGNAASTPRQTDEQAPARFSGARNGLYRKSAAQAKRDGDHEEILRQLSECLTEPALDAWAAQFDDHTARLPETWLDPIRDEVEKRRNTILDLAAEAERVPSVTSNRALLILANDNIRAKAVRWIADAKKDTRVTFQPPKRTIGQNDKMWAMLTDVAIQHRWHGLRLHPGDWKKLFMAALNDEARIVPNLAGDGFVNLGSASSELSIPEMSDLIELMYAWGAEPEHLVVWSEPVAQPAYAREGV